jgi:dTDP-4-amino-4,6-dideoxygalactose transaminase
MRKEPMSEYELMDEKKGIPLFRPYVPKKAIEFVSDTLNSRWIGEGPKVKEFEIKFQKFLKSNFECIAVNSGTAALHLAYILAAVKRGDEVICPLFTCTATNLPILYQGAKPVFCDVAMNSLNINVENIESLITKKTKAISVVDYGGLPNNYEEIRKICDKYQLKLISDCAHCVDGEYKNKPIHEWADFTIYSFQAIKTLTTGDGGILICNNKENTKLAKKVRWFGIDREKKQSGIWENDVTYLGYKYHMNDIAASIGLASLLEIKQVLSMRMKLFERYIDNLSAIKENVYEYSINNTKFTPWLLTLNCYSKRLSLMKHLRDNGIESAQVHYRNDRYSIFSFKNSYFPNMDKIENSYLVLPLHMGLTYKNIDFISKKVLEIMT